MKLLIAFILCILVCLAVFLLFIVPKMEEAKQGAENYEYIPPQHINPLQKFDWQEIEIDSMLLEPTCCKG